MEWHWKNRLLLLLCATIVSVQIYGSKGCFQEEKTALIDFKEYLKLQNDSISPLLPSWVNNPSSDCCHWERVTCNSSSGHVIQLSLDSLYVNGSAEKMESQWRGSLRLNLTLFLSFKELRSLSLSSNYISDFILTKGTL